ncbi:MAG TPA: hypothetical protein VGJ15_11560 [Pirellulales bacterium]
MLRLIVSGMLAAAAGILARPPALAAAESAFLSGEALRQAMSQKVGASWSNLPLRQALERFCKTQKLGVLLDRRIDPDQKIELAFDNVPLSEALARIAAQIRCGFTMLGPVAYFGPQAMADRLQTLAALRKDDVAKIGIESRGRWVSLKPWQWEMLATPRELLANLGKENNVQIDGLSQIPHDLWAAADLPPLALADRLTLLLAQFDLTFEPAADGKSIRLVPAPEKPTIEHSYAVSGSPQELATKLKQMKMLAEADIKVVGNKLVVRSRQEDQDAIADLLAGKTAKRTTVTEPKKVYTLRVEAPVSKLLKSISQQLELDVQIDRVAVAAAGISMEKSVSLDVKEATTDELLHAVLDPVGLAFEHHGNVVEVKPKGGM